MSMSISGSVTISGSLIYPQIDGSADRCGFQTLSCASVWVLGEDREAMIIVANHRHICWAREHNDQSAFKSQILAEMEVLKISVPNGIAVGTFDNTSKDIDKIVHVTSVVQP